MVHVHRLNINNYLFYKGRNVLYLPSKHCHMFCYGQAYKKFICIDRHFACVKRKLEDSSRMLATVRRELFRSVAVIK